MKSLIVVLCAIGVALLALAGAILVADAVRRRRDAPSVPSHVELVQDGHVRINAHDPSSRRLLRSLGASRSLLAPSMFTLRYASDATLARLLGVLRDAGFALGHQPHGWPPSAVFEDLRDRGLVSGSFLAISWTGPDQPVLTTR